MQLTRRFNDPVGDLFAEFDRFFRGPLGLAPERTSSRIPRGFSLYETSDDWRLRADLPGFAKKDLEITLEDGILTITAEHGDDAHGFTGNMNRSLRLPKDLATDRISASLENGVLEVTLPKREPVNPEPTRIEIS
jgi:HSP20 family protein